MGWIIKASVTRKNAGPGMGTAHMAHLWVVGELLLFYHVTPLDLASERRTAAWTGQLDDCAGRCAHDQAVAIRAADAEQGDRERRRHLAAPLAAFHASTVAAEHSKHFWPGGTQLPQSPGHGTQ